MQRTYDRDMGMSSDELDNATRLVTLSQQRFMFIINVVVPDTNDPDDVQRVTDCNMNTYSGKVQSYVTYRRTKTAAPVPSLLQ